MLLVNGEKMSKSLGNFLVLHEVLDKVPGEAVRFLLMRTHYRSTLDFTDAGLVEARRELDRFYRAIAAHPNAAASESFAPVLEPLCDDLNTPGAIAALHVLADAALAGDEKAACGLLAAGQILGLFNHTPEDWFHSGGDGAAIDALIAERRAARAAKDFARADEIRRQLEADGIVLEDNAGGTIWRRKN
jgi:cysteinyl-tRNA synthetase